MSADGEASGEQEDVPDGWIRRDLIGGMDTVGSLGLAEKYEGIGGGYCCRPCDHYVPIDAVDEPVCPMCGYSSMIGTVIMGTQEVTALHPEGWSFDD
ncbi:hypothetical protein Hbl1158_10330 [Halobaculum sp. CBA1158]|uniref:hypothetical protein n=1 Tax=Halobaculum sp. CBA1158 TaxID=2904243 RepID=UPI001F175181|nr:hypothetical protein [Halobaculum sp. CBA1158]UIO98931.1 hypothetical protein Hbl1158_10330 [Halobaculum sp. CBA1158]